MKYLISLTILLSIALSYQSYRLVTAEAKLKNEQHYRQLELDYLKIQCNQ